MYEFNRGFEHGYRLARRTDDYKLFLEERYRLEQEIRDLRRQAEEGPAEKLWDTIAEVESKGYYLFGFIEGYHEALAQKRRERDAEDETTPAK